jgi:RecA/RadA recombinase
MAKKKIDTEYYFKIKDEEFFTTGCAVLDCVLGHGWVNKHATNIIGSSRTGKSLLALEAVMNYRQAFPDSKSRFADNEVALNKELLEKLGFPSEEIDLVRLRTIEEFFNDFDTFRKSLKEDQHGIYVCDSLDALSDEAERSREISKSSFGAAKAKKMNEIMRRVIADVETSNMALLILSQAKDSLSEYGPRKTRQCGPALEFFADHILWLTHKDDISIMRSGITRPIGTVTEVRCSKNRVARPGRICTLPILFERGVNDVLANLLFLDLAGELSRAPKINELETDDVNKINKEVWALSQDEFNTYRQELSVITKTVWDETEKAFDPPTNKRY